MVLARDIEAITKLALGTLSDFNAYLTTSYVLGTQCNVGFTSRLWYGLEYPATEQEEQTVHFLVADPCGRVWENSIYLEESANGPIPTSHEVYLGAAAEVGAGEETPTGKLQQDQQVPAKDALTQNPTLASHLREAIKLGKDPAIIPLPGNSDTILVPKDQWPTSGNTSLSTNTTHTTPTSSATNTPKKSSTWEHSCTVGFKSDSGGATTWVCWPIRTGGPR